MLHTVIGVGSGPHLRVKLLLMCCLHTLQRSLGILEEGELTRQRWPVQQQLSCEALSERTTYGQGLSSCLQTP